MTRGMRGAAVLLVLASVACARPHPAGPAPLAAAERAAVGCYEFTSIPIAGTAGPDGDTVVDTLALDSAAAVPPPWVRARPSRPARRVVEPPVAAGGEERATAGADVFHYWQVTRDSLRIVWHNGITPAITTLHASGDTLAGDAVLHRGGGGPDPSWTVVARRVSCPWYGVGMR